MLGRKVDSRVASAKMASLCVAWGVAAALAYVGGIYQVVQLIVKNSPWPGPGDFDQGLVHSAFSTNTFGQYSALANYTVIGLPFAIVALILFGAILRARPTTPILPILLVVAALVGLVGSGLLFFAQVATSSTGVSFVLALLTIVLVFVLVRIQQVVRRFYKYSPAFATLFFALLAVVYIILSNGASITSIILKQIDIWLSLISFAIALFASFRLSRHGARLRAGR